MTFESLGVSSAVVELLKKQDIIEPTEIQAKTIPAVMQGKDVIGKANTGGGKTLAFGLPILERVETGKGVQALILAPTRELAVQISNVLQGLSGAKKITIATVFGGVALGPQVDRMARSEIVVGTPGRVLDHLGRGTLKLGNLKNFTLDEADKMVEMGFIEDVREILNYSADDRQILLFGATLSEEIRNLKAHYMTEPFIAEAARHVHKDYLEQYYFNVQMHEKFSLLVHLLKTESVKRAIIFCSTRTTVDIVTRNLKNNGINAEMIHGKLSQNRRLRVIDAFNKGKQDILVASAVAARGLDIKDVSHVFNYDLPRDPQEYIHRVGRTARAGASGKAFSLLSQKDHEAFGAILHRYPITIEKLEVPEMEKLKFDARSHRDSRSNGYRGRNDRRPMRAHNSHRRRPEPRRETYEWSN